jgi:hypothetical protein
VRDRAAGLFLFLPVPLVLGLFTRMPLGVGPSLLLGIAVMASHRLYARPFALSRASRRCLWCGGAAGGPAVDVRDPLGEIAWRACGPAHEDRLRRVLGWASAHARFLQVGILGGLGAFVIVAAASAMIPALDPTHAVAGFRLAVAATVLPFAILGPRAAPAPGRIAVPLPVHIQALLGTAAVLWLFRIVGLLWLAQGAFHLAKL